MAQPCSKGHLESKAESVWDLRLRFGNEGKECQKGQDNLEKRPPLPPMLALAPAAAGPSLQPLAVVLHCFSFPS